MGSATGTASETRITFCRVCEATCGLEVDVEDGRAVAIRPDPKHVVSRGYACVKGTRWTSIQNSPDRLLHPLERRGDRFVEVSWRDAMRGIARRIAELVDRRGPQTFGHFVGSAGGANLLAPMFRGALYAGLGSSRMYGTGTCDTMNKFRVNEDMYGSPMRLAHPDVDHTSFMLVIGANPAVSGNTLFHLPRAKERYGAIAKRGGRVVFVNPRRVETASAGEHLFIRPDTDLFFLAAFCNELIRMGGVDPPIRLPSHVSAGSMRSCGSKYSGAGLRCCCSVSFAPTGTMAPGRLGRPLPGSIHTATPVCGSIHSRQQRAPSWSITCFAWKTCLNSYNRTSSATPRGTRFMSRRSSAR